MSYRQIAKSLPLTYKDAYSLTLLGQEGRHSLASFTVVLPVAYENGTSKSDITNGWGRSFENGLNLFHELI